MSDTLSSPIPVIVIHGGAGTMSQAMASEALLREYQQALHDIVSAGQAVLAQGGSALDAVCVAVEGLETCPLFNAGRGAVYTAAATHELDAAVMTGQDLRAGAVTGVTRVRNPVYAARAVMERTPHVLLSGQAAEQIAFAAGVVEVDPSYFDTPLRLAQLHKAQAVQAGVVMDHWQEGTAPVPPLDESKKFGTVGAVALDAHGHLAAATSTGGMTNKLVGRIGDSPLIGAGTYADDRYAAISCTGHGESFIRVGAAHDVCARMAYGAATLAQATDAVVFDSLPRIGGTGGLIAVDAQGNVAMPFNTEGMYRASARVGFAPQVGVFRELSGDASGRGTSR